MVLHHGVSVGRVVVVPPAMAMTSSFSSDSKVGPGSSFFLFFRSFAYPDAYLRPLDSQPENSSTMTTRADFCLSATTGARKFCYSMDWKVFLDVSIKSHTCTAIFYITIDHQRTIGMTIISLDV
jgi:hypothetical protein